MLDVCEALECKMCVEMLVAAELFSMVGRVVDVVLFVLQSSINPVDGRSAFEGTAIAMLANIAIMINSRDVVQECISRKEPAEQVGGRLGLWDHSVTYTSIVQCAYIFIGILRFARKSTLPPRLCRSQIGSCAGYAYNVMLLFGDSRNTEVYHSLSCSG